jgi:hypothetical protein
MSATFLILERHSEGAAMNGLWSVRAALLSVLLVTGSVFPAKGADAPTTTKAQVDVNGTWTVGPVVYKLIQTGDSVVSESSFGRGEGHFTGPNTFVMTFFGNATFTATVQGDTISWSNNFRWTRQRDVTTPAPRASNSRSAGQPAAPAAPANQGIQVPPSHQEPPRAQSPAAPARAGQLPQTTGLSQQFYFFCEAGHSLRNLSPTQTSLARIFLTNVFQADMMDSSNIQEAFRKYIQEQYSLLPSVKCRSARNASQAESDKNTLKTQRLQDENLQGIGRKLEIVETGWVYGAASGTQAQPPAPAPEQTHANASPGAAGVTGTWALRRGNSLVRQSRLTLRQDGGLLTGTLDQLPLEGSIDGNKVHFTVKGNDGVIVDFKGTLQGEVLVGVANPWVGYSSPEWGAKRQKY